jgi:hypothetical protein
MAVTQQRIGYGIERCASVTSIRASIGERLCS